MAYIGRGQTLSYKTPNSSFVGYISFINKKLTKLAIRYTTHTPIYLSYRFDLLLKEEVFQHMNTNNVW